MLLRPKDVYNMLDGYIRVAAATPSIRVADCANNAGQILSLIKKLLVKTSGSYACLSCVSPAIPAAICFCRKHCWKAREKL